MAKNLIPTEQHLDEDEFVEVEACTMEELKEKILQERLKMERQSLH